MQQRKGLASEWQSANPILAGAEFGFETDTGKFKIGNGTSNWAALDYFTSSSNLKAEIIGAAPETLNTLNELAAAIANDSTFAMTVLGAVSSKANINSPSFTGTVDFSNATVSGVILPINWLGEYNPATTYLENDMVQYQGSVYYATGPNIGPAFSPGSIGADWDLFASKGDTGPTGPAGPEATSMNSSAVVTTVTSVSSNYSITNSDRGTMIVSTGNSITITINNVLAQGENISFAQYGTGQITFAAGSGVTLNSKGAKFKTSEQYAAASVFCTSPGQYLLVGSLI
jgi:hypothetical protein